MVGGSSSSQQGIAPGILTQPAVVQAKTSSSSSFYTYSSPPQPLLHGYNAGRARRFRHKVPKPRGIHDYFNISWDPHVRRGITSRTVESGQEDVEAKRTSENGTGVKMRKKRSTHSNMTRSRYKIHQSSRGMGTPPPFEGRYHSLVQTETYLEDLTLDVEDEDVAEADANVQTDPIHDYPVSPPPPPSITEKTGIDASTQIIPGELSNFDEEIEPILATLVQKIVEQALMETMEEEELAALKEQQNRFQEKKKREEKELRALQEQHQRIAEERELLRRHLETQNLNAVVQDSVKFQSSSSSSGGPVFTTSYLLELLPSVLSSLRQEGFLNDTMDDPDTLSAPAFTPNNHMESQVSQENDEVEAEAEAEVGEVNAEEEEGKVLANVDTPTGNEAEVEMEDAMDEIVAGTPAQNEDKEEEKEEVEGDTAVHEDNKGSENNSAESRDDVDQEEGGGEEETATTILPSEEVEELEEVEASTGGTQELVHLTSKTMENET